jgi:hypothetical protein
MNHRIKRSLWLAILAAAIAPMAAFAADAPPYATFEIKVEESPIVSEVSPVVTSPITKDTVAFHIVNNSGKALYFNNGEADSFVPLVSNSTVEAAYAPGKEYKLMDGEGNMVATWHLGEAAIKSSGMQSASASEFAEWSSKLHQVIENQKVTYQEPPAKPEPHYYEKSSPRVSDTIRGYW